MSSPVINPTIYAYSDKRHKGVLKIGYTERQTVEERVKQQYGASAPEEGLYTIHLEESAVRDNNSIFKDTDVHAYLERKGFRKQKGEWFKCGVKDVRSAIIALKTGIEGRSEEFAMRPEQRQAVEVTAEFFKNYHAEGNTKAPRFLWNAKMRFGKTFAAYHLALEMGWKKILVLTFKPAVEDAWQKDLMNHVDFAGWQFISKKGPPYEDLDQSQPFVCFGSFQDFLGRDRVGVIKPKNKWVHKTHWDCVIFDEYHYGAWRDNAQGLFEIKEKTEELDDQGIGGIGYFEEEDLPITTNHYLYLSGTPFRAIAEGHLIEEQIFNWTYSDEQREKQEWKGDDNPYAALPRMVLMTYQLPPSIREVAMKSGSDEFDLNIFFSAEGEGDNAKFIHESEVQKWLDLIRGQHLETNIDNLKMGANKTHLSFSDGQLPRLPDHTFWFFSKVASCQAMANLLKQNVSFQDYKIIVAAGKEAGTGVKALRKLRREMGDPLTTKTITLSCGKLATGVSVEGWMGILMLCNLSSPETYFQAAFRVQTPWETSKRGIIKHECYVFDFAPNRALKLIAKYGCELNVDEKNRENNLAEFIKFLPVLAYEGGFMTPLDAGKIIEMAVSGTTGPLLARRWESAVLVNVDDNTLQRLIDNEQAMTALKNIEGFRNLNSDIETIINRSEVIKNAKEKANKEDLTKKDKKELTEAQKERKSQRKMVQEKLIKFATRIPIFMYLTDYREENLEDVVRRLDSELFKKVTGLSLEDFDLLVSLDVFNAPKMDDAIFMFKRYESTSLSYTDKNERT